MLYESRYAQMVAALSSLASVSSLQCVDVLWRLGFTIEDANETRVRLVRADGRRVTVPRHKTIDPIELRVILMTASVEETAFIEMLNRRQSSEVGQVGGTSGIRLRDPSRSAKKKNAG